MKRFKKRTLALVLASAITVVGAFGEENYRNSLMSLNLKSTGQGRVYVVLQTKEQVTNNISPIRRGANTYVIRLPETNSQISEEVPLVEGISSMDIKTMPYTTENSGYTQITFTTLPDTQLRVHTELYIPAQAPEPDLLEDSFYDDTAETEETGSNSSQYNTIHSQSGVDQTSPVDINESLKQFQTSRRNEIRSDSSGMLKEKTLEDLEKEEEQPAKHKELLYIFLGAALVVTIAVFLMLKAKDKLVEITGEQANYDVSDEPKSGNKKKDTAKKTRINTTINNIDKKYTRPETMPTASLQESHIQEPEEDTVQEVENIVDLDELLKEKNNKEPNNDFFPENNVNNALEDFLSSYNFDDESSYDSSEEEKEGINEELYDKCINEEGLEFSKDDVDKIETLIDSEISDETKRLAPELLESSEKNKRPTPTEILEKLVTTYITQQNILFTKEDIDALYKLISVEIDDDFITDLRTNPTRMQEMQDEIARQKAKPHKTSELLTLNVKDMLPDLSEALKKQGGRRIESEVKPQVVYASEGYEVSTLKLNTALPDLSAELNNEEAYKARPSDDIQYVDTNYEVQKMSIANELPDLEDMLKHPEKYETPEPEEVKVDEEALLRNITNVTFKPFDDGTRQFEIINDLPTVSEMQAEFNQFGDNFEIINEEEDLPEVKESEQNDFETLYDGKYVDLDREPSVKNVTLPDETAEIISEPLVNEAAAHPSDARITKAEQKTELKPEQATPSSAHAAIKETGKSEADKLLSKIKDLENERKAKITSLNSGANGIDTVAPEKPAPEFCVLDGKKFEIVNVSYFTDQMGCYLAKNESGYSILGFTGDKVFKIKYYEKLDTEKLQSRVSEKLDDGTMRYIIRLGIHKFILNVKQNDMEFVMDLC